jgi:hypothetical protein
VTELTDRIDLSAWPEASHLICRSERPHPGAQFTIFDENGYRYTCFLTGRVVVPGRVGLAASCTRWVTS